MMTIKQTYHIKAPIEEVWRALVDPEYIEAWGGGPAEMDDKGGTKFKLWGGDVYGKNKEVVPPNRLVQEWYSGNWPEPSVATFELLVEDGGTRVEFLQENVPEAEAEDIAQGWKDYYSRPPEGILGNQSRVRNVRQAWCKSGSRHTKPIAQPTVFPLNGWQLRDLLL